MERYLRHRYALALPFLALALVLVIGGALNVVTARGRLIDDFTDRGVKDGKVTMGQRQVLSAEDGSFVMDGVPRTTGLRVDAGGYLRTSAPPHGGDVRLSPLAVTVQVNVRDATPIEGVPAAQIRRENRLLTTMNPTGGGVITPHPGRDASVLICAKGFRSEQFPIRGVTLEVTLARDAAGDCPPLPSPSPAPGASPSPVAPSPRAPSPSPSPR